jgi:hypothetical protein
MDGMSCKHCPKCDNYVIKSDPRESGMCKACGWVEHVAVFYCEPRHRYCILNEDRSAA